MRWNWGGTRTGEARICRRVGAGEGRGRGAKSLGGRGEVCVRETRQARLVLRDRSMDPGVGAWSKEGRAREEGNGQRQRRVGVSELLDAAVEAARTSRRARPPGPQQQDIWGTLLIGCSPKVGLRTFPNVRLAGALPQEAQEADHRWDPPRLRIRLARLLPCSSSPSSAACQEPALPPRLWPVHCPGVTGR